MAVSGIRVGISNLRGVSCALKELVPRDPVRAEYRLAAVPCFNVYLVRWCSALDPSGRCPKGLLRLTRRRPRPTGGGLGLLMWFRRQGVAVMRGLVLAARALVSQFWVG